MVNNVVLVGRVADDPRYVVTEAGYRVCNFTLAVRRDTRDENNEYDCDFLPISAWQSLSEIIRDYVHKGSLIGVRCRLGAKVHEVGNQKVNMIHIYAENVSFISTNNKAKEVPAEQVFDNTISPDEIDSE